MDTLMDNNEKTQTLEQFAQMQRDIERCAKEKSVYQTKEGQFIIPHEPSENHKEKIPNDKLHCEDGPALIEYSYNGKKCWYYEGKLHREDGPAWIERGDERYYKNGVLHRIDGPAVRHDQDNDGRSDVVEWWINGLEVTRSQCNKYTRCNTDEEREKWMTSAKYIGSYQDKG